MDADRIKGAAQDAGGKLQQGIGKLTREDATRAEGAARELGGKMQGAFGSATEHVRDAVDEVGQFASDAVHQGGDYARQGADYAKQGAQAVERSVKAYPLLYLLAAAGIGFVAAMLLSERNHDSYYRR